MKVKLIQTEGEYLEAQILINNSIVKVMDNFCGDNNQSNKSFNIVLEEGIDNDDQEWEDIFSSNPNKEKKVINIDGWKYILFGEIISNKPCVLNCGVFEIEISLHSNDDRIIGEFISYKIDRLDASLE